MTVEKVANNNILEMLLRNRLNRIDGTKYIDETLDDFFDSIKDGDQTLYKKVKKTKA